MAKEYNVFLYGFTRTIYNTIGSFLEVISKAGLLLKVITIKEVY